MGRKARFNKEDFIESALDLLAEQGPASVTMAAIAQRTSAPVGSVYHRFASREVLMAELWVELIESFQLGFLRELQKENVQKAALYTLKWIRKHPNKARVFLLYRREQLVIGEWPPHIKERAAALVADLHKQLSDFTQRFLGKSNKQNMARVAFCLIHAPTSAVRDYLEAGKPVPRYYDQLVLETCQAVLEPHLLSD